jgi:hypothetical protein
VEHKRSTEKKSHFLREKMSDSEEESEEESDLEQFEEQAAEIAASRITPATRKNYNGKIEAWKKWLKKHSPESISVSDTIILPLNVKTMIAYLGSLVYKDSAKKKMRAHSTIMGYYSAIKFEYSEKNIVFNGSNEIFQFLNGYLNTVALAKEKGLMPSTEGKQPLSFKALRLIAEYSIRNASGDAIYAHLYLLLCWNIIGRTSTTAHIHIMNVSWNIDSLTITIPRHKGDQTGQNVMPKHIFANPFVPALCPILAFSIYIFSFGFNANINNNGLKLFDSSSPEDAFSKWLHAKALKNVSAEDLGMAIKDVGTHSLRKGAATYVSSFDILSETTVNLRAGWSLGKVISKYIKGTPGADQLVGRLACGLNILNAEEFLILPPHFDDSTIQSWNSWKEVIADFENYPTSFRKCLEYLIGSLTFHYDWILENLHSRHPLFTSRIWTNGLLTQLKTKVILKTRKCSCHLIATGVPTLWNAVGVSLEKIENKIDESITLSKENSSKLEELANEMPYKVCEKLNENFTFHGQVPVTALFLQKSLEEHAGRLVSTVKETILAEMNHNSQLALPDIAVNEETLNSHFPTWSWGGKIHLGVPENFIFPSCTTRNLWIFWFFGYEVPNRIRPFRLLKNVEMPTETQKRKLKKARILVKTLLNSSRNHSFPSVIGMDYNASTALFTDLFKNVCKEVLEARKENSSLEKARMSRFSQLKWSSLLNEVVKYRIFPDKDVPD